MNVRRMIASVVMKRVAHRKMILKVAYRYLMAVLSPEYDKVLKLQVLEGAAGVPWGSWFRNPSTGMRKAQQAFEETQIDPSWFGRSGSMYDILYRAIAPTVEKAHLQDVDPEDFIQDVVFPTQQTDLGVSVKEKKKLLYGSGEYLRDKILSGRETPESVAKGASGLLKREVYKAIRKLRTRQKQMGPTVQDEALEAVPAGPQKTPLKFVADIVDDPNDPLGEKIRKKMYELSGSSPVVQFAVEKFERTGRFPSPQEIIQATGAHKVTVSRAMGKFKQRMQDAMKDPSIARELDLRLEIAGLGGGWKARSRRLAWEKIPF